MPAKIEIYENTLLKLLVRRGTNTDRQNVVLTEGEIGYTTDTKRLFVGDGQTTGGIVIGTTFLGNSNDVTTLLTAAAGDYAYDADNNVLYIFQGGNAADINNWKAVGGVYSPNDATITFTGANNISVGKLSAGNVSSNLLGNSLTLDTNNKIALSSTITTNSIVPYSSTYLKLPQALTINNVSYQWPAGGTAANYALTTDIAGNLSWAPSTVTNTVFVAGSANQIPVGSIMPYVSTNGSPQGWLLCNGQQVLSSAYTELFSVIGTSFNIIGTPTGSFNVPNLINKSIYGVSGIGSGGVNNPATSTLFKISSGINSPLSATGMLYIIKAKPDFVVSSSFTVTNGLSSTVNGALTTGTPFNPLSGNLEIGLSVLGTLQTVVGGKALTIDRYGRTTGIATESAGTEHTINSSLTYNGLSPISFLQTPITIFKHSYSGTTMQVTAATISAYPLATILPNGITIPPLSSPTTGVPSYAKNLILDCNILKAGPDSDNTDRFVLAAINTSKLTTPNSGNIGNTEYVVGACRASGSGDSIRNNSQVMIPLSATATGDLTCAFRISPSKNDDLLIRIVGYTV